MDSTSAGKCKIEEPDNCEKNSKELYRYLTEYIPVIDSGNSDAKKRAGELEDMLTKVMNDENHKWSIGKEDPADKADRAKRGKEFKDRYK